MSSEMSEKLSIHHAERSHAESIARIHKKSIAEGFLSKQSDSFLIALYGHLIEDDIVYIACFKNDVVGFVAATATTNGLYKKFLLHNLNLLIPLVLKHIFSPKFIFRCFETLIAPYKTKIKDEEMPELLSIAIDKDNEGQTGVGTKLVKALEDCFIEKGIEKYKVVVGSQLDANKFYRKLGFIIKKEIEIHGKQKSYVYEKVLKGK